MFDVLGTAITALATVACAVIANRGRQHAKAARAQVENSHSTNLREEGDERHEENRRMLTDITERLSGVKADIRGLRRDVGRLADADRVHDERIHELERTQPPPRKDWKP